MVGGGAGWEVEVRVFRHAEQGSSSRLHAILEILAVVERARREVAVVVVVGSLGVAGRQGQSTTSADDRR